MNDFNLWTGLTLDTTPAATDRIVKMSGSTAAFDSVELDAIARAHTGTAFPVANLYDGYPFHRTNIGAGMDCFYDSDNTQWLTSTMYEKTFNEATISASTSTAVKWVGDVYAVYVDRVELRTNVATTNNGSNYWTIATRSISLAQAPPSDGVALLSVSTGDTPDTAGTYYDHGAAAASPAPASSGGFYIRIVKTSSPGDLTYSATVKYRLIIT